MAWDVGPVQRYNIWSGPRLLPDETDELCAVLSGWQPGVCARRGAWVPGQVVEPLVDLGSSCVGSGGGSQWK